MFFAKRDDLVVHEADPFNAESPAGPLAEREITPIELFYVRGHGPVPDVPRTAELVVDGLVQRPLRLRIADLPGGFGVHTVTATLQCAGNRRADLIAHRDIPGEAAWGPGATGTARWTGVALADVLAAAGPVAGAAHVAFTGADVSPEADPPQFFAGSVPLEKALRPEVLLAFAMDGAPLPAVHGGPLRAVVPGYIGARSVKWLTRVEVRRAPSDSHFEDVAYRLLAPEEAPGPGVGFALGEVALNAAVLAPADGARLAAGPVVLRGYAFAGGDRRVERVDVSGDGGASWTVAELGPDLGRWAWRLWRAQIALPPGRHELVARAWDSAAATMPESAASVWNPKGYANNAWSRVTVTTDG